MLLCSYALCSYEPVPYVPMRSPRLLCPILVGHTPCADIHAAQSVDGNTALHLSCEVCYAPTPSPVAALPRIIYWQHALGPYPAP
eukprot:3590970-Rhodomonas_salina.1